jgi:hypothetical protein
MTAMDRAYLGMERIKRRLIGNLDLQEWDLPPKPKWMRVADLSSACRTIREI